MSSPAPVPAADSLVLADKGTLRHDGHAGAGYRGRSPVARVVARWHDGEHRGAFSVCDQQPCDAVRRVDR